MAGFPKNFLSAALALALLLAPAAPAKALSCIELPLLSRQDAKSEIILARVRATGKDQTLSVQVLEVLRGTSRKGRYRVDSRSHLYWGFGKIKFPGGSVWVFKVVPVAGRNDGFDYNLSPCDKALPVTGARVRGWISAEKKDEVITLQELKARIAAPTK